MFRGNHKNLVHTPSYEMRRLHQGHLTTLDDKLVDALKKAIASTNEVFNRRVLATSALKDHMMQEQIQSTKSRVGFFVNCLRRELAPLVHTMREVGGDTVWYQLCDFLSKMIKSDMWSDIAVPRDCWGWSFNYAAQVSWHMTFARMKELIQMANTTVPTAYKDPLLETTDQIGTDLAKLEKEMYSLVRGVDEAKRINTEADKVVGGLVALAETLPKED